MSRIFSILSLVVLSTLHVSCTESVQEATVQVLPQPANNESFVGTGGSWTGVRPYGYPRCGGNYSSPTGGIFYKPFTTVMSNERCVWIINANTAKGYAIDIQYLDPTINSNEGKNNLIVTGFRHGGPGMEPLSAVNYIPSTTGKFKVQDVNTIIVTFATSNLTETSPHGFVLQYVATHTGNVTQVSQRSTQRIIQASETSFRYPDNAYYRYYDYELSPFVVVPENNVYNGKETSIMYRKNGLEGSTCYDSLFVYKLNLKLSSDVSPWEGNGRICGNMSQALINHDDVVLLLFQTDASVSGNGFSLSFNQMPTISTNQMLI